MKNPLHQSVIKNFIKVDKATPIIYRLERRFLFMQKFKK